MGKDVKISVIIPVYNTEKYLRQCLDTVCGQTLKELQIICVDDGSTDGSVDILNEYSQKDSRIQVIFHEHTGQGAAGARNKGLDYAVGEYLLILDSDDYFDLKLADKAYKKAKMTDADIVLYNAKYLENDRYISGETLLFEDMIPSKEVFCAEDCPNTIFQITRPNAWSKLWRREFIQENGIRFQNLHWLDDALFVCKAMAMAKKITILDERLVNYRYVRAGNQTSTTDKDPSAAIKFSEELKVFLKEKKLYESIKVSFWDQIMSVCSYQLSTFKTYDAYKTLYNGLKNGVLQRLLDHPAWEEHFCGEKESYEVRIAKQPMVQNIKKIMTTEPEDMVFSSLKQKLSKENDFPVQLVEEEDKVVLYGAGATGKNYFLQNMNSKYCQIIAWADKAYSQKGFPICAPQELVKLSFDKVLIAIDNKKIADEIRKELLQMGIEEKKILWSGALNV